MARFNPKLKARQSAFGVRRYSYLLGFTGVKFPLVELRSTELAFQAVPYCPLPL